MLTASTYRKELMFKGEQNLDMLMASFIEVFQSHDWNIHAYVFFANHYHALIEKSEPSTALRETVQDYHRLTAMNVNHSADLPGRKVWFQYWDSSITFQKSYLARIQYIHMNPVRHGLVKSPHSYKWSSLHWFEQTASPTFVKTVSNFDVSKVNVRDDFEF